MPLLVFERGLEAITVTGACCGGCSIVGGLILCIECLKGGGVSIQGAADDIDDNDIIEGSSISST